MIGGILGALGGIAGAISQNSWQQANYNLALENLRWQKQQGERQFRLSSAGRTDAFGNKQKYNEYTNEWDLDLTPTQQQIISAGETEQKRSLTEDAARNRKIRERQAKRGDQAAEDYVDTRAAYKYGGPKDEAAIRGEIQSLLQGSSDLKTRKSVTDLSRDTIRQGRGALLPSILAAGRQESSSDWANNLLKARQLAMAEHGTRTQAHESQYLPVLRQLQETMDLGGDMPQRFSTEPQRLATEQGQGMQFMLSALKDMASGVNNAAQTASKAASQGGIDLRGFASALGGIGGGGGRSSYRAAPTRQSDILLENIGSF